MVERLATPRVDAGSASASVVRGLRVAHLTTVDVSLRYLLLPQLTAVIAGGGEAIGVSAPGVFVPELEAAGIRHVPLQSSTRSMNVLADLRSAAELWRVLRRERPDILHTHNPKPGVYGRIVGRLAGVPIVVNTVHGLYASEDDRRVKRAVVYGLEAFAARFSHAELVQSPEDVDLLRRYHIVPRRKLVYLGNGVDLARFDRSRLPPGTRASVRAALGVRDDDVVIGIVGRLVAEKGHPELFDAVRTLGPRCVLVVVGPDDPEKADALDRALLDDAAASGVRFLGMRDDVDRLYAGMDVFALPSHREGFPRAAMEAAAMGLPIVATDIRGCRQVVTHGDNGLLVPVRDPARLAETLRQLVDDAALRQSMGESSARRSVTEFDERAVVAKVFDAYARALAPSLPPLRRRHGRRPLPQLVKRALDIAVAATALVVLAPVVGLVALAVRIGHGRPILFAEQRPGRDGVPFRLYKFRTMRDSVDADGRLLPDEERLTRLGRLLRATSLDELPELVNVLRGEMSIVGPRPLLPEYLTHYTPQQSRRHEVRPGITGLAQVNGRNASTWDERLTTDVWYVDNWSVGLDLRIIMRTVPRVLAGVGIRQEGHATMPRFDERPRRGEINPLTPLVIIGAGGHGREALDIVEAINARSSTFEFLGFVDERRDNESLVAARGARIIGSLDVLRGLDARYVIGVGSGDVRRRLDEQLRGWGYEAAVLVHPAATIGAAVSTGVGVVVAAGACITTNVALGRHAHVNVNASVSHDCRIDDYVTVSPGTTVCGNVSIGQGTTLGAGSTVIQNRTIGAWVTVGAGAVVVNDLADGITAAGVPARPQPGRN